MDTHFIHKAPGVELIENYIRYSVYYPFNSGCTNRTYGFELTFYIICKFGTVLVYRVSQKFVPLLYKVVM